MLTSPAAKMKEKLHAAIEREMLCNYKSEENEKKAIKCWKKARNVVEFIIKNVDFKMKSLQVEN